MANGGSTIMSRKAERGAVMKATAKKEVKAEVAIRVERARYE